MRRLAGPTLLAVVGFLLLQAVWVATVPPFRGSDEFDHAYRAAAVARGQWVTTERVEQDRGRGLLVAVPASLVAAAHGQCDTLAYTGPDNCAVARVRADGLVDVGSGAGNYHPAFYWLVGTAALPLSGDAALYAMRAAAALLCAAFVGLAAWSATRVRSRWALAGLLVALTPVLVYSTALPAPNGLEMCTAAALWTSLLSLSSDHMERDVDRRVERRLLLVAVVSAVVLGTLRLLGPLYVVAIVALVVAWDPRGTLAVVRRHARGVAVGAGLVAAAAAGQVWWTLGPSRAGAADPGPPETSLDPWYGVVWAMQSIAAFPYRDQIAPAAVYAAAGALVVALLVLGLRSVERRGRWVLLAALALALLLPYAATLATLDGLGVIWQGRYGLPAGMGFVVLSGYAAATRHPGPPPWAAGVLAAVWGVAHAVGAVHVRQQELADNPVSAAAPHWLAPAPVVVVAVVALGMAAYAASVTRPREAVGE